MSTHSDCVFCKIIERKLPSKIIYEDSVSTAFEDINPQAPVHILIVPKKHIPDLHSIAESDKELIGHLFLVASKMAAKKNLDRNGYRMVINNGPGAGQTVFHIHIHLLAGRRFSWPPG